MKAVKNDLSLLASFGWKRFGFSLWFAALIDCDCCLMLQYTVLTRQSLLIAVVSSLKTVLLGTIYWDLQYCVVVGSENAVQIGPSPEIPAE